jgi:hypothetical protein
MDRDWRFFNGLVDGGLEDVIGDLSGVWFGAHGGPSITLDHPNINQLSL